MSTYFYVSSCPALQIKRQTGATNTPLGALKLADQNKKAVPGSRMVLTKDCKLKIIAPDNKIVWSPKLDTSEISDQQVALGQCYLVVRNDGDLALYGGIAGSKDERAIVWTTDACVYN